MTPGLPRLLLIATTVFASLVLSESAHAFRCGTKLVRDGMHEQQVIAICGQPTSARNIGHTVRAFDYRLYRPKGSDTLYRHPGFGTLATDVVVTEYVYNFGPRKLMRRLIFEGGVLVTIESIGYGYIEK
jgi:hypothetical protein